LDKPIICPVSRAWRFQSLYITDTTMKNVASKIGAGLFIAVIAFFGLKGCVVAVWKSPGEPTTYALHGKDGRSLATIFLPGNETLILYMESQTPYTEAALTAMRGSFGTHYFWRLWNVDVPGGNGPFGYRIFPEGARPVTMETTVLRKFTQGSSKPTLRSEGDTTTAVLLFTDNAVRFQDMWLEKEPTDREFVQSVLKQLKVAK
jgi:hypothetical protein